MLDFALSLRVLLENYCRMDGGEDDEIILWNEIATDFDPEEETLALVVHLRLMETSMRLEI